MSCIDASLSDISLSRLLCTDEFTYLHKCVSSLCHADQYHVCIRGVHCMCASVHGRGDTTTTGAQKGWQEDEEREGRGEIGASTHSEKVTKVICNGIKEAVFGCRESKTDFL